jgi:hypothetical protein
LIYNLRDSKLILTWAIFYFSSDRELIPCRCGNWC